MQRQDLDGQSRPWRIGVAVLYRGDSRALDVSLRSLRMLPTRPDRIVVAEDVDSLGPPAPAANSDIDEWLCFAPVRCPRGEAVRSLLDCDLAVIIGEGVVVGSDALQDEIERFRDRPRLRASMVTGKQVYDLSQSLSAEIADPFRLLMAEGANLPKRAPLYFSPCMLTIAIGRSRAFAFERYAHRSDWASAHLYLDSETDPTRKFAGSSRQVGLITQRPDRREALAQGYEAVRELTRLGNAHPEYRRRVRHDLGRLIWLQCEGIVRGSLPAARWRFLRGVIRGYREESAMKRNINRSIPDLS